MIVWSSLSRQPIIVLTTGRLIALVDLMVLSVFCVIFAALTLFRMSFFGAAQGSQTHPTLIRPGTVIPYLKKIQKVCESRDTPHEFCRYHYFFTGNQQTLLYLEIQIQTAFLYIISNFLNFYRVFKDYLINVVTILIMSAKSLFFFRKIGYEVITFVNNVLTKFYYVIQIIL